MVKYIYICAAGHSGSTLLDRLLGSHANIESLGEISHLPKNIALNTLCTCGEPVKECAVWGKILRIIGDRLGHDFLKHPYALNLGYISPQVVRDKHRHGPFNKLKKNYYHGVWYLQQRFDLKSLLPLLGPVFQGINNNFLLYDTVRSVLDVDMIVDSSKHYLKAIELYRKKPTEVRIIQLTRDGRGVYYSALKRNFPPKQFLNGWINHYSRALVLLERHISQEHLLRVKYEDLAKTPRHELRKICDFLRIDFEDGMLDFAGKTQHSTNGNNMRFSKSSEISLDNAWRAKLSAADKKYFNLKAGALNCRLGYDYNG